MPFALRAVSTEVTIYILESWTAGIQDLAVMMTASQAGTASSDFIIYVLTKPKIFYILK